MCTACQCQHGFYFGFCFEKGAHRSRGGVVVKNSWGWSTNSRARCDRAVIPAATTEMSDVPLIVDPAVVVVDR